MESADESFEKLEVWRRSHGLSIEVYRLLADCRDGASRIRSPARQTAFPTTSLRAQSAPAKLSSSSSSATPKAPLEKPARRCSGHRAILRCLGHWARPRGRTPRNLQHDPRPHQIPRPLKTPSDAFSSTATSHLNWRVLPSRDNSCRRLRHAPLAPHYRRLQAAHAGLR